MYLKGQTRSEQLVYGHAVQLADKCERNLSEMYELPDPKTRGTLRVMGAMVGDLRTKSDEIGHIDLIRGLRENRRHFSPATTGRWTMAVPRSMDPADPSFNLFRSPFYLIAHADFKYHEDLDKVMAKAGIDRTTYRLLTVLMQEGPANIKVVCEHALLKRSTGGRAIERMREKGWVKTALNEVDHRVTDVELTPAGKKMAHNLREVTSRQLHRATSGISTSELRQFDDMLVRIIANLSKLPIE